MISFRKIKKHVEKEQKKLQHAEKIKTVFQNKADRYVTPYFWKSILFTIILQSTYLYFAPWINIFILEYLDIQSFIFPLMNFALLFFSFIFNFLFFRKLFISKTRMTKKVLFSALKETTKYKSDNLPNVIILFSKFEKQCVILPDGLLKERVPKKNWDKMTEEINFAIKDGSILNTMSNILIKINKLLQMHTRPEVQLENLMSTVFSKK